MEELCTLFIACLICAGPAMMLATLLTAVYDSHETAKKTRSPDDQRR